MSAEDTDLSNQTVEDPTTVKAVGHFAALLLTVRHRDKVLDIGDFGNHLAMYACLTAEADPSTGTALAYWAAIIKNRRRPSQVFMP